MNVGDNMALVKRLDLHGQTIDSARRLLTVTPRTLPKDVEELVIIHGYHGGTAIADMVRSYRNSKIERKILSMNNGETIFVIKQDRD